MKFFHIFLVLLLSGFGISYYFIDKWFRAEFNKNMLYNKELSLKNDQIIKEAREKSKKVKVEDWKPLGSGYTANLNKSAYLEGIGPITNIDCSQIYRSSPNSNRPIAYLNGVALNGILQPNSKIQQAMAQTCRM